MMATQHKALTWIGWFLSTLVGLMLAFSATLKLAAPDMVATQMVDKFEYPKESIIIIGIVEFACLIIYLVPQTAVLGAILLTGYLGGAVATHVRVHDVFIFPIIFGVFAWLGLFLRDPRIRSLLPLRRRAPIATPPDS